MTAAESAYWGALVQVLPVFGLALVLEARTIVQSTPPTQLQLMVLRRWQVGTLALGGLAVAAGMIVALGALNGNEPPGRIGQLVVNVALGIALGSTLTAPLMNVLVHTESDAVSWFLDAPRRRAIRKAFRDMKRVQLRFLHLRRRAFAHLLQEQQQLERVLALRERVRRLGDPDLVRDAESEVDHLRQSVAESRREWRKLVVYEHNIRLYYRELKRSGRSISHSEFVAFAQAFRSATDPISGVGGALMVLPHRLAPDDGGFMFPDATAPPWPRYHPDDEFGFVTDPTVFYRSRS